MPEDRTVVGVRLDQEASYRRAGVVVSSPWRDHSLTSERTNMESDLQQPQADTGATHLCDDVLQPAPELDHTHLSISIPT